MLPWRGPARPQGSDPRMETQCAASKPFLPTSSVHRMCMEPPDPLITFGWQVYETEQALSNTFGGFSQGKSGKWQKTQTQNLLS